MNRPRHLLVALCVAVAGLALVACTDVQPATAPATMAARTGQLVPLRIANPLLALLACNPEPYDSVVQMVGPQGGTIHAGPHTLVIPPGALDRNTTITAVVPADTIAAIRFQPQGLVFARPAWLTMSYANCPLAGLLAPTWIVYANDAWTILEIEPSLPDLGRPAVTGRIRHFSGYAVAY